MPFFAGFFTTVLIFGYGYLFSQIDRKIPATNFHNTFFKVFGAFVTSTIAMLVNIIAFTK